jgi:Domain of unknown function (DUF4432)
MPERDADFQLDAIDPAGALARSVGLERQAMAADLVTRQDGWERGVRSVLLQNDRIAIEVVVDRGLDIASARIRQIPIGWRSPTEIVAPWFVENAGFGPHRGFFGGLLTTCGLDHIGVPVERSAERFGYPARPTDTFPMHGRVSGTPARLTAYGVREINGGLEAFVEGAVTQVAVFGEHLTLTRRVSVAFGTSLVRVEDEVSNHGYATSPLAVMYHVNIGWPVVAPGARIRTPSRRLRGEGDNRLVRAPVAGAQQRVWVFAAEADEGGRGSAGIANAHVDARSAAGVELTWDAAALPTLVQWEMSNIAGHYVIGLEPSTALVSGGADGGGFPTLEPGQSMRLGVAVELLHGAAGRDLLNDAEHPA